MGSVPRAEPGARGEAVLVAYELPGGAWAWCYRELEGGFELHSNLRFRTREEAVVSARRAYPDVPFAPDGDSGPRRR